MNECEKVNDETLCDWCDTKGEVWACVDHAHAEGGETHLHICGGCNEQKFDISERAVKQYEWGEI